MQLEPPQPAAKVVSITSAVQFEELPKGFFRCRTASGKESLAYNGNFLAWEVGETVVDGGRRVTLSVPRESLPIVNLNFGKQQPGIQQIGSTGIIDSDVLDGETGVVWDGAPPRDGVEYI